MKLSCDDLDSLVLIMSLHMHTHIHCTAYKNAASILLNDSMTMYKTWAASGTYEVKYSRASVSLTSRDLSSRSIFCIYFTASPNLGIPDDDICIHTAVTSV